MRAIITKIQDGKVYAKSVNPLGERRPTFIQGNNPESWEIADHWQQAESDRVELPLDEDSVFSRMANCTTLKAISVAFKINDEIQVTREGNYFKII